MLVGDDRLVLLYQLLELSDDLGEVPKSQESDSNSLLVNNLSLVEDEE